MYLYYSKHINSICIHVVLLILFAYENVFSRLLTYMIRFGFECTAVMPEGEKHWGCQ